LLGLAAAGIVAVTSASGSSRRGTPGQGVLTRRTQIH